jgi:hypothetical protein
MRRPGRKLARPRRFLAREIGLEASAMVPSGLLLGLLLGVLPAPHAVDLQSTATAAALAPSGTVPSPLPLPKPMSAAAAVEAGAALLRRVLPPTHLASFSVEHVAPDPQTGHEVLEYEAGPTNGTVILRGSSAVAVASALQWYLKTEAAVFGSRSWSALPPFEFDSLPSPLPKPAAKQRLTRPVQFSWYTNVWCAAAFLRLP